VEDGASATCDGAAARPAGLSAGPQGQGRRGRAAGAGPQGQGNPVPEMAEGAPCW
jgi:hypothetical protein